MGKLWEFFENMNEIVYVSDMDTYQLVYMNKKARSIYEIDLVEQLAGRKCYEILQAGGCACAICNNEALVEGQFIEWHHYNPVLQKHYMLKDTMIVEDGRRYRLEIALDDSLHEQKSVALNRYENLETLANEGLRVALTAPTAAKSLDIVLEYIGRALHGQRTYIFEKNAIGNDDNTYEWVATGVRPAKDTLQNLPAEICRKWYQNFQVNNNIIINDLEEIRESDPLQYENLKQQDIHSLVVVPLYDGQRVFGFYGVDNAPKESLEYAANMLQIMGHFIVSSLKRRNLEKQLQNMSYHDQLTGIGNRYALEEYIGEVHGENGFGVVYCDVTGLKRVNDEQGYTAGDYLILQACASLQRVFGKEGLFRIGGDELLVLCNGIDEKVLEDKVAALRQDAEKHQFALAVGSAWQKSRSIDMDRMMADSEKLMYADKAAYYREKGIDRRR